MAFSVTTSGGSGTLSYQWRRGAANVPGATGSTMVLNNVQLQDAGTYYVRVTDAAGQYTSIPATLTVEPATSSTVPVVMSVHTAAPKVLVVVLQTPTTYLPANVSTPDDLSAYTGTSQWAVDGVNPTAIYRYSIPWDEDSGTAWNDPHPNSFPVRTRHRLYLVLPTPLEEGVRNLTTPVPGGPTSFTFDSTVTFCESLKVNQVGYNGSSEKRYANFGIFMGDGGTAEFDQTPDSSATVPTYQVIDETTGTAVFQSVRNAAYLGHDVGTAFQNSGEHVYRLDLSEVPDGGPYFVYVPGAGRSRSFGVGAAYSQHLSYVTFRGLYHQRCGMDLSSPYTAWTHASCHNSIALWLRSERPQDDVVVSAAEGDVSPHPIEGGYHDAADMDHTTAHPQISINMLSFYEAFKPGVDNLKYNIPTSLGENAAMPDFLQEILWGVKLWEALQIQDSADPGFATYYGAVMAGWSGDHFTEYGKHDSDQDPNAYGSMAVNPDVVVNVNGVPTAFDGTNKSTAFAAGIFAHTSRLVRPYDENRADELLDRALAAWAYLERTLGVNRAETHYVYAALQLYLATGESEYRDVFLTEIQSLIPPNGTPGAPDGPEGSREGYRPGNNYMYCHTAHFVSYLLLAPGALPAGDNGLQARLRQKVLDYADNGAEFFTLPTSTALPDGTTYPFGVRNLDQYNSGGTVGWGSATAQGRYADVLMYAYRLSPQQRYLNAVSLFADYSVGLNPLGMSYYTGLGTDQPNSPAHCDSWAPKYGFLPQSSTSVYRDAAGNPIGNVPGILVYGPMRDAPDAGYERPVVGKMVPAWTTLPFQRRYAHGWSVIKVNEFTTHETMTWNLMMHAFLATH